MKRNIKYTILSLIAPLFLLCGCYSLDKAPDYQVSDSTFWQTETHAREGIVGVYAMLHDEYVCGQQYAEDMAGEIAIGYDMDMVALSKGEIDATSDFILNKWQTLYESVARANRVIRNVSQMQTLSSPLKARYIGEAKFLRAFFYFTLLNNWGGVPYYDETCIIEDNFATMLEPRMNADTLRCKILADLDSAIVSLPEQGEWGAADYGRATKGAAQALKGKVLLYGKRYEEAAALFKQVTESGKYSLNDSYKALFTPEGDSSDEIIFSIQNSGSDGMAMALRMGSGATFGGCLNNMVLSTSFVDSYEYYDGTAFDWDEWFPGFTKHTKVRERVFLLQRGSTYKRPIRPAEMKTLKLSYYFRDPRMQYSVILPYMTYTGWTADAEKEMEYLLPATGTGHESYGSIRVNNDWKVYLLRKFVPEGNMGGKLTNSSDTPVNFPLIRYADVLLMYAECLNETGDIHGAATQLNKVRARVKMPKVRATTKEAMFQCIRHERAVELVGEGHNFMDLKRWGLLGELDGKEEKDILGGALYTRSANAKRYNLLPIPSHAIELNPKLAQNPEWGSNSGSSEGATIEVIL